MVTVGVDQQGRIVLPKSVRRRFGLDGRAGRLRILDTPDGVLLVAPPARATVHRDEDGLPAVTIDGFEGVVENEEVIEAIDQERATR